MDETIAFLDGVDVAVSAAESTGTTTIFSSFTNSSTSALGHDHLIDSDGVPKSLSTDSEPGEFVQCAEQQEELPSQPAAQTTKPRSNSKSMKATTPSGKVTAAVEKPVGSVKRPRKHNKTEILNLREQVEEL